MTQAQRGERPSQHQERTVPHPPIVSHDQWLDARKKLLAHEKELTKHYDRVNAERRRLPMVKIEKDYVFDGPDGKRDFKALFEGRRQLIVYHFMFDPAWDKGCPGCTGYVDALGDLSMLRERDTTFALVSRAPLAKLEAYRRTRMAHPWYSSFGTRLQLRLPRDHDPKVRPSEYNYRSKAEKEAQKSPNNLMGEEHGLSVFFRSTTMCSTPTRLTRAAPKCSPTPASSTRRRTDGSRTSRTRRRAGRRSRPTEKSTVRQVRRLPFFTR